MVTTVQSALEEVKKQISHYSQEKATGKLIIRNSEILLGTASFLHGRLLYLKDELHPVRRFSRACRQVSISWPAEQLECSSQQPWEYQLLYHAISKKQITVVQAKTAISNVAQEFLFDLITQDEIVTEWESSEEGDSGLSLGLALSTIEVEELIETISQMQGPWQEANLSNVNPSVCVVLAKNAELKSGSSLANYLNGKFTLWDIGMHLQKSVIDVTRALIRFKDKELIEFREVADLSIPSFISIAQDVSKSDDPSKQKKGLIACIDDSPVVAHSLKKLLAPLGYEVISITEPMHGFSDLVDKQPNLIFLDLMMPNVNGYSVCKFLRETESFQEIPIIILTAQSGAIDRARAKMAGANDFLGKPPQPGRVVEIVQRYLS